MKSLKRKPALGSYVERLCTNVRCETPFEKFPSLSGAEDLCPRCGQKAEIARLRRERAERVQALKNRSAGIRLIFGAL